MENNPDSYVDDLPASIDALYEREKTLTFTSSLYDFMTIGERLDYLQIQGLGKHSWYLRFRISVIINHRICKALYRERSNNQENVFTNCRIV